jgi:hypothetical protein
MIVVFFLEPSALQRRDASLRPWRPQTPGASVLSPSSAAHASWRRIPSPEGGAIDVRVKPIMITSSRRIDVSLTA